MKALSNVMKNPLVWISIIYLLFPVDIVADAIPVAGTVDDLIILILTLMYQDYCGRQNKGN